MRVISYNLREHSASGELIALAQDFDVDVLCLQEADTHDLPHTIGPMNLADSTKGNRLGLAVYYRQDRFTLQETNAFALKKSMHDRVLAPAHERLVGVRLVDNQSQHELVVGSFHAAPLSASNSLRRHQIRAAHEELINMGGEHITLMVGDFNYPFFIRNLAARVKKAGYDLTLSDRRTYTRYAVFKGHFDFATSLGLNIESIETLPRGLSDHLPILVSADYAGAPPPSAG
jgi:endonuclease/exonuclease/phosphatase family metal-dependent hydrolase